MAVYTRVYVHIFAFSLLSLPAYPFFRVNRTLNVTIGSFYITPGHNRSDQSLGSPG